jgi:hypothetical protein
MKEDEKQQALNEIFQRLAQSFQPITERLQQITQPFQQITQLLQPLTESMEHIHAVKTEIVRGLDESTLDELLELLRLQKRLHEQRKLGGRVTGEQRTQASKVDHAEVIKRFHELKKTMSVRGIAGTIARETKLHPTTVRRILRKAGLK